MADRDVRVDQAADSGDELGSGPDTGGTPSGGGTSGAPSGGGASGPRGTKGVPGANGEPSDGTGGSADGSGGPPGGAPDENPLGDPKDGPPTAVDDGGIGSEGLVGAGGSGGGDGGGGLLGGIAHAYDQAEDLVHDTYDDVEEEAAETYDDAGTWESGEHRGTLDRAASDLIDDLGRDASDVIDDAARDAGDAFRDSGDAVNDLYDRSGADPVIDDARDAGAVVVPDVVEDVYDHGEDQAHRTYGDIEAEVVETYEDASVLDHDGEDWGGLAGTPDDSILDVLDPDHHLEEFSRDAGDAIDEAARDAGDAFRDSGDAVNDLYDRSGADPVIDDARDAGAVVVPDVVEDVYDQGEDLAHQTYGDIEDEVVETYEDASVLETKGEHWGGIAGMPDQWLDPLVDGAENVAETPGEWYEKSGVDDFGSGNTTGIAGDSSVPDVDDFGRGTGSGAPDPFAPDPALASGADETAQLATREDVPRLTAEVDALVAHPGPVELPGDPIDVVDTDDVMDVMEAPDAMDAPDAIGVDEPAFDGDELIEPV